MSMSDLRTIGENGVSAKTKTEIGNDQNRKFPPKCENAFNNLVNFLPIYVHNKTLLNPSKQWYR